MALTALLLLALVPAAWAQEAPKILEISGKARLLAAGKDLGPAKAGRILAPGQAIQLAGAGEVRLSAQNGRVEITAGEGAALRYDGQVNENSQPWKSSRQVQLAGVKAALAGNTPQFTVGEGQVTAEVTKGQPLRLVAPLVTAAVRGTRFSLAVAPDGSSNMNTQQGRVEATSRSGQVRQVSAGGSLSLSAGQFADFLKTQGISVPRGDWRQVSPAALEKVDDQTFAGRFADAGAASGDSSLDALLADPNGSPMAGQAAVTGSSVAAARTATTGSASGLGSSLQDLTQDSTLQKSLQAANQTNRTAQVAGHLTGTGSPDMSSHGWATTSGTFGFDVGLKQGNISNARMDVSGDATHPWNTGSATGGSGTVNGNNFAINNFTGGGLFVSGSSNDPSSCSGCVKNIIDPSTALTGTAPNGFDAVGNPVNGNFNIKAGNIADNPGDNFSISGPAAGSVTNIQ
jgi:hypothetical protein